MSDGIEPAADRDRDLATYNQLLDLWKQENPIKTNKLQVLLAVNGALLSVVQTQGGFVHANWPVCLGASGLSLVWTLSIGRTTLFQELWQVRLRALAAKHRDDPRFQLLDNGGALGGAPAWLRFVGGVSSKYYLLGTPLFCFLGWLVAAFVLCVFARGS